MQLQEFERQFRARRQEAQQERDELSKKADDFLKEFNLLLELLQFSVADLKAGRIEVSVNRLRDRGFDNLGTLVEKLHDLYDDSEGLFVRLEKLEGELNRQSVTCPTCGGRGSIGGKPEWIEGDTGRIQIPKFDPCPLCEGKQRFTVDELLHR